jgi:lysyl-tRNA synthetase class 2
MADSSAPAAPAPPTDAVANLHLDEVTGEMISKTEKKKRDKQRAKEADKAAKAANAPPKAASKPKNSAGEEEDLNPNQYHEIRSRAVNERTFSRLTVPWEEARWPDIPRAPSRVTD